MLTWLGLVSVLVEHSLKKIVDIKAALTLDRKYKAARAFIAL